MLLVTLEQPDGNWVADAGVAYTAASNAGTALVPARQNPAAGQYVSLGNGQYLFSAADAAAAIGITYGFIPADLEEACLRLVVARYQERERDPYLKSEEQPGIGMKSYFFGDVSGKGDNAYPPDIEATLERYRVPVVA